MGAADLAEELRRRRPETRVLFMSGYADDAIVRHRVLEAGTAFLQKPFTPSSLGEKLREVLAAPAGEIPAKNGAASRASADGVS
jgi:FixJ family two-component response regulator